MRSNIFWYAAELEAWMISIDEVVDDDDGSDPLSRLNLEAPKSP